MRENVIEEKSYIFAVAIIKFCKKLVRERKEYILSKQLIRCGTAIGAIVREAAHAQSKADFLNKMNIALKEANETIYWLQILKDSEYISVNDFDILFPKANELVKILVSIVRTMKNKLNKN